VRTDSKGDSDGGRSAIEDAATQVTRGVNGFIECLAKNLRRGQGRIGISLIPAIFTTAKLFVSDVDLRQTDLARGEVDAIAELKPEPWLWLQYHVSPGLRHSVYRYLREKDTPTSLDIGHLLETEYARTIAIVGSDGVDAFLASQRWMF
jgi:hypothetical protein